jgi:hypothetical protein
MIRVRTYLMSLHFGRCCHLFSFSCEVLVILDYFFLRKERKNLVASSWNQTIERTFSLVSPVRTELFQNDNIKFSNRWMFWKWDWYSFGRSVENSRLRSEHWNGLNGTPKVPRFVLSTSESNPCLISELKTTQKCPLHPKVVVTVVVAAVVVTQ